MKKNLSILVIFLLQALLFADISFFQNNQLNTTLHISVEPLFGIRNGILGEYVFLKSNQLQHSSDSNKTANNKLSYLEWQIKNELYAGIKLKGTYRGIIVETSLNFGFPQKSGIMTDSDWYNIQKEMDGVIIPATTSEKESYKTCYSEHNLKIDSDFFTDIIAGYSFPIIDFLTITPFINLKYSNISLSAKDGWGLYGFKDDDGVFYKYNDNNSSHVFENLYKGKVISYQREQTVFSIGSTLFFSLPYENSISIGGCIAPAIYTLNFDTHHTRSSKFADVCYGWFNAYEVTFDAQFKIHRGIFATLNAKYFKLNTIKGKTYYKETTSAFYNENKNASGGASARIWTSSFGIKVNLL